MKRQFEEKKRQASRTEDPAKYKLFQKSAKDANVAPVSKFSPKYRLDKSAKTTKN